MLPKYITYKKKNKKKNKTPFSSFLEYVKHNAHFPGWLQILSLSEAFDNTEIPLSESCLGIHNTECFSFLPTPGPIFFSVSLTYSCSSSYPFNVTEILVLFSPFLVKIIRFPWSQ